MKKFIAKTLAIILSAALTAGMFAMFNAGMVNAEGECPTDLTDIENVETLGLNTDSMELDEIEACIDAIKTEKETQLNACLTGDKNACSLTEALAKTGDDLALAAVAQKSSLPIDKLVQTAAIGVTDMFEKGANKNDPGNQCMAESEKYDVTTFIEEPLDIGSADADANVRNCTRNTFCIYREDKMKIECVTTINKEGFCSENAITYAEAHPEEASINCRQIQAFFSTTGTDIIYSYIGTIYRWAASIIGIIAVLVIVISGIQISASGGDQQAITNARNRILESIGGIVLLFLSAIILNTINSNFFTT